MARPTPGNWGSNQTVSCPTAAVHMYHPSWTPPWGIVYRLAAYDILIRILISMNMLSYTAPHHLAVQCCSIQLSDQ
jgi:hypothetical protein